MGGVCVGYFEIESFDLSQKIHTIISVGTLLLGLQMGHKFGFSLIKLDTC